MTDIKQYYSVVLNISDDILEHEPSNLGFDAIYKILSSYNSAPGSTYCLYSHRHRFILTESDMALMLMEYPALEDHPSIVTLFVQSM